MPAESPTLATLAEILAPTGFSIFDYGGPGEEWRKVLSEDGEKYLVLSHEGELVGPIASKNWLLTHHYAPGRSVGFRNHNLPEAVAMAARLSADYLPPPPDFIDLCDEIFNSPGPQELMALVTRIIDTSPFDGRDYALEYAWMKLAFAMEKSRYEKFRETLIGAKGD